MNRKVITNAVQSEMPSNLKAEVGKPLVINLAPPGEYPQTIDDPDADGGRREVVQILDEQAIDTLIENFKDKVLVDADHSSETSTDTKAMAWVTRLFKDPDKGLMAEIEPTTIGAENINGKVYRFVSGAWTLDDDGRPVELVSIGLTNRPNLPVAPMINSKVAKRDNAGTVLNAEDGVTQDAPDADAIGEAKDDAEAVADSANPHETVEAEAEAEADPTNTERKLEMDIREKLGLPPEATDEEVEQAFDALLAGCESMDAIRNALNSPDATNEEVVEGISEIVNMCRNALAEKEEAQQAQLNAEAEQLVAENEDVIPEEAVEGIKEQYVEDPEAAKETVANMRKVYDRAVRNSRVTRTERTTRSVAINWSSARKPVALNMESMLADCGGDPEKENALLRSMNK